MLEATGKTKDPSVEPVWEGVPLSMVTFRAAFWVWVKVGLNSFGGPAAQIAVMHRYLVVFRLSGGTDQTMGRVLNSGCRGNATFHRDLRTVA